MALSTDRLHFEIPDLRQQGNARIIDIRLRAIIEITPRKRGSVLRFWMCDALQRPFSVVERREMDSMECGKGLDFLDPLPRDEASPLGERLETSRQCKDHA